MEQQELIEEIKIYIEKNIESFHNKRIEKLKTLKLKKVLQGKNPYLFKAKNISTAKQLIEEIIKAYLSSSEEGIFGDWLEGLAIFINQKIYQGRKSSTTGIDLEFDKDNIRYIVSIKSGPNWGNSSQILKMIDHFNTARRVLKTSGSMMNIIAVNGCCYGISTEKNIYKEKGDYFKYCGQKFWEFISGMPNLYAEIIEPLGHVSSEKNTLFEQAYQDVIADFTATFSNDFCNSNGEIDWKKLLEFNSASNFKNK